MESLLRLRISNSDISYGGNLVDGAKILKLYGDAATEILIKHDGDEGLFVAYENVEFLNPVYGGDYIEIQAKLISVGKTSRKISFSATIVARQNPNRSDSAADFLSEPILASRALGTCVVPENKKRIG